MPKAPPIDLRTYDEIVAQTEKLAYQLSGWKPTSRCLLRARTELLIGMTLDENLSTDALLALRGAPIDTALAQRIAVIAQGRTVYVRAWLHASMPALVGETLDEDVIAVDGTITTTSGTPIDASLARSISARRLAPQVRLTAAPDPATLTGLTLDEDIDDASAGARRGSYIDAGLAQRLSAALRGAPLKVLAAPADMAGRAGLTLREDVYSATIVAARDTLIDKQHASAIAQARPDGKVRVRPVAAGQAAAATVVAPDATALVGQVLDEDVLRTDLVASSGATVDEALAQLIAAAIVAGPVRVLRQIAADPARLAATEDKLPSPTLGEDLADATIALPCGALLDPIAARSASALRLPRDTWVRVQVHPGAASLAYAVLQEPIVDSVGVLVAPPATTISPQLAERIRTLPGATPATVRVLVPPVAEWLDGAILDETIVDGDGSVLASSGTLADRDLAERISILRLAGLPEATPDRIADYAAHGLVWVQPPHPDAPDDGGALIRIFGRMMDGSIVRLNQALEKQRLAFLNMIGAEMLPPQAARAALTFQLAPRSTGAFVPSGTRVLSQSGADQVGFETDQDLVLTTAQLAAALACDTAADRCDDYTRQATGAIDQPFRAFAPTQPIEHSLYLASDAQLTMPGPQTATISLIAPASAVALKQTTWWCWDGTSWSDLKPDAIAASGDTLSVTVNRLPALKPLAINGCSACWIRAQPAPSVDLRQADVQSIYVTSSLTGTGILPTSAFANTTPLDLSKDFYPFGERPSFNDTLYLGFADGFGPPAAQVAIDITLTNPADSTSPPISAVKANAAVVQWEAWCGDAWVTLGTGWSPDAAAGTAVVIPARSFNDGTQAFTTSGIVTMALPDMPLSLTSIGGVSAYWMRARLIQGDYGKDATYTPTPSSTATSYEYTPASFAPPAIQALSLGYTSVPVRAPITCLTYNNGIYEDVGAGSPDPPNFRPFAGADDPPALYLGFDKPFPNLPVALFLEVEPVLTDEPLAGSAADPPRVAWAYASANDPSGWAPLAAVDETRGLTQHGLLRFLGPADAAKRALFGQTFYWLRASWQRLAGAPSQSGPQLRRVLTNTTWATQATTITGEALGPSDGSLGQIFHTRQAPVLPGQRIEVFEREIPPNESAALVALEGSDAITPVRDAAGHATGAWVRWHAVPDFYASGPRDRHYCFDAITGEVRFGDGYAGLIPPPSRQGVRAALYRVGGGARGNCPAGAITQLAAALPFVPAVSNLVPASGGVDAETVVRATERAPRAIRHGGRAVAAQDYEDLALAASPAVARALVIPAGFAYGQRWLDAQVQAASHGEVPALERADAGQVGLILVPRSADPRPTPNVELVEQVRAFILARCPPTAQLWIGAPGWDCVTITAEIAPVSLAAAESLERAVLDALRAFLHPLTGGVGGQGWPFGRIPYPSDIYALLASIPGVDHVGSLCVCDTLEGPTLPPGATHLRDLPPDLRARFLIYSGSHSVTLIAPRQGG